MTLPQKEAPKGRLSWNYQTPRWNICAHLKRLLVKTCLSWSVLTLKSLEWWVIYRNRCELEHISSYTVQQASGHIIFWLDVQMLHSRYQREKYYLKDAAYYQCALERDRRGTPVPLMQVWAAQQLFLKRSVENAIKPIIITSCGSANIYIES